MKNEFTPGPWFVENGGVFSEEDHFICDPSAGKNRANKSLPIDTREANAALICAAPDLLNALENLEAWVNGYAQDYIPNKQFHETGGFEIMESARYAISNARGH